MKRFEHFNAKTTAEAVSLLKQHEGKAKLIAGGTDLLGVLKDNIRPTYPEAIINIKTIPNLDYIKEEAGTLKIGALAKLQDIAKSTVVKEKWGLLAEAAHSAAYYTIRYMGTLGGNLCQEVRCWYYRASKSVGHVFFCYRKGGPVCYAVPGDNRFHAILGGAVCFAVCPSDTAVALTALDAKIKTARTAGERTIDIKDFYITLGNVLDSDEIVTEIQVPTPPTGAKQTWTKFARRKALDFATVSVASVITVAGGVCTDARIALGAVAPTPIRATGAEDAIKGGAINETTAAEAADAAVAGAVALSHNAYKIEITKALVKRAILS